MPNRDDARGEHEVRPFGPRSASRRSFLKGGLAAAGVLAAGVARAAPAIPFGAAVRGSALATDEKYAALLARRCAEIVCEGEMKWGVLRPTPNVFDFGPADKIADFARAHRLTMRGHTLVWYAAMPLWTESLTEAEAPGELARHIETVVGRYRDLTRSWDVVNEPLSDKATTERDLRPDLWNARLGPGYIETAFRLAHAVDPTLQLVLNEADIEHVGARYAARRAALRTLLFRLLDKGAPVHAVGIQGHLRGNIEVDGDGLAAFAAEMKQAGLDVLVTELDVVDDKLPASPGERDRACAQQVDRLLSAISAAAPPRAILTWGITDRYTWVPIWFKRRDGLSNRPLPFDDAYAPKPMWDVIARRCGHAP
jgi:endo-1,4-beta-xylanase